MLTKEERNATSDSAVRSSDDRFPALELPGGLVGLAVGGYVV